MNREAYKRRQRRVKKRAAREARRVLFVHGFFGLDAIAQGYLVDLALPDTGLVAVHLRDSLKEFAVQRHGEGVTWVRGWYGEIPDAFRAQVALTRE